ncbi:ABC transporter permease [Lactobacillus sp. Sy-1]|uniref:ABC transporter permease n=1 Tax=Lactobacillus sp. Sy-1 TaxID=2109645 RepID=UPI001C5B392C|nr:ABC transporter permease [Lactobacillus sp. Sy-1]MBW1606391.1 ABC transporter permease [Lactobacillus sp. Sy-1]
MHKLMAITAETYVSQVKTKSFIIMLLLPFIIIIIGGGAGFLAGNSASNADSQFAIIGNQQVKQAVVKQDGDSIDAAINTEQQATSKLKRGDIDGYAKLSETNGRINVHYVGNEALDSDVKTDLMKTVTLAQNQLNIQRSKLNPQQLKALAVEPAFSSQVKKTGDNYADTAKLISLEALIFILYIFLLMYSGITASVIAKEKGSKITEIIFSSTSSTNYFIGKVFGIILMMLTQMVVYVITIGGSYQALKHASFLKNFMQNGGKEVIGSVLKNLVNINSVFVILGLIIGIILSATCGALVSKAEDANKAAQPVMYLIMGLFFASLILQNNSDAMIAKVLSYVPVSSTFFMPIRIINHQANGVEVALSLLILIGFTVLLTYGIAKKYKGLMLQSDDQGWFKNLRSGLKYR